MLALVPASAKATTFCVPSGCRPPDNYPTIPAAVQAAKNNGAGLDAIQVKAGTYTGPFEDDLGFPVDIRGAGQEKTILRKDPTSMTPATLTLNDPGSRVSDLTAVGNDTASIFLPYAIEIFDGLAQRVNVRREGTESIGLYMQGGTARAITANLPNATGLLMQEGLVDGINVTASDTGIQFNDASEVRHAIVTSTGDGVDVFGPGAVLRNSLIRASANGMQMQAGLNDPVVGLLADHVTAIGNGGDNGVLALGFADPTPASADVTVRNSVLRGFDTALYRDSAAGGGPNMPSPVDLTVEYSSYDRAPAATHSSGPGTLDDDTGNIDDLPAVFANQAKGDFRPRFGSALIDRGSPGPAATDAQGDLLGQRRVVGARRDMGAYEYQRRAPSAGIKLPSGARVGLNLAFSATNPFDFDLDPITLYSWTFGDGASANGATAHHGYGFPGAYPVVLRVRDSSGLVGTRAATLSVAAAPGRCANSKRGTAGRDTLVGSNAGDRLSGLAGNDVLRGLRGADCLDGGTGNDRLTGASGNDRLAGGSGRDRLGGDSGNDRLSGGSGNDRLSGGRGRDAFNGGSGNDRINSRDRRRERVRCGRGRRDRVKADRRDRLSGCERVSRR